MAQFGDEAIDTITSFTGIVIGITEWLNGCRRIGIQPQTLDKDGKPPEVQWFDEQQVGVLWAGKIVRQRPTSAHEQQPGGPRKDPKWGRE